MYLQYGVLYLILTRPKFAVYRGMEGAVKGRGMEQKKTTE